MSLLTSRLTYLPFKYPKCYEYFERQQQVHWLWSEVPMAGDVADWHSNLTDKEKAVVAGILKGFVTVETLVNDYWTNVVGRKFKHPEIQMMAATFASFEAIHTKSYAYLNETLGLENYAEFIQEPTTKAKLDCLVASSSSKSKHSLAKSLAIFSAFTEGVNLFSSFAVLLNFSRFNKLKGVGQIISWSIRDESLHSEAGCYLFRTFIQENLELWTDDLKKEIYEAARNSVELEDNFIDKVFEQGSIEGLDPKDLKQYIRMRANTKLADLGLKTNWKTVDKEAVDRITSWFDVISSGVSMQDFFAGRVTEYSKGNIDWSKTYD